MDLGEREEVAINFELFKKLRIFNFLGPNSLTIFNYNAYRLTGILLITIAFCDVTFGFLGSIIGSELKDTTDSLTEFAMINTYLNLYVGMFKTLMITYNADELWDVLQVTRKDFLSSYLCLKNISLLDKARKTSIYITNFFTKYLFVLYCVWFLSPLIINAFMFVTGTKVPRYENVSNYPYPVTTSFYNKFYFLFYLVETIVVGNFFYFQGTFNILFVSFIYAVTAQYEIVLRAFEIIGHDLTPQNEYNSSNNQLHYDELISVLKDQRRLYLKLEKLYSSVWSIVLIGVFVNSCCIVVEAYPIAEIATNASETSTAVLIIYFKQIFASTFLTLELYCNCYVLDTLNTMKDSVSFGMYCSNWTEMDLKFQKTMLMSMRMNDANKLMIKATPLKIINLMLFASVMMTTYNIVSVLVKTKYKS